MPRRINPASVRFLKGPEDIPEEEEELPERPQPSTLVSKVSKKIEELSKDYDLSDMKPHDWTMFREMAVLMVRLEEEQQRLAGIIQAEELDETNALRAEQRLAVIREGILKIQESLGLTRAKRIDQVENDPRVLFEDIKARAKRFLDARLAKLKCPKCNVMLASVHFVQPEADNQIKLTCHRCGFVLNLTSKEAIQMEARNTYV